MQNGEHREILRPADGEPIRKIRNAERRITLVQLGDRSLRFVRSVRKRMARRHDADDHQEDRHLPERLLRS